MVVVVLRARLKKIFFVLHWTCDLVWLRGIAADDFLELYHKELADHMLHNGLRLDTARISIRRTRKSIEGTDSVK